MAFQRSASVSLALLFCFFLLSDGLSSVNVKEKDTRNRKLSVVNAKEAVFKIHKQSRNREEELRVAPLGPDPLHHHGADPKKPTTP